MGENNYTIYKKLRDKYPSFMRFCVYNLQMNILTENA